LDGLGNGPGCPDRWSYRSRNTNGGGSGSSTVPQQQKGADHCHNDSRNLAAREPESEPALVDAGEVRDYPAKAVEECPHEDEEAPPAWPPIQEQKQPKDHKAPDRVIKSCLMHNHARTDAPIRGGVDARGTGDKFASPVLPAPPSRGLFAQVVADDQVADSPKHRAQGKARSPQIGHFEEGNPLHPGIYEGGQEAPDKAPEEGDASPVYLKPLDRL
jgi:hypothetical protein